MKKTKAKLQLIHFYFAWFRFFCAFAIVATSLRHSLFILFCSLSLSAVFFFLLLFICALHSRFRCDFFIRLFSRLYHSICFLLLWCAFCARQMHNIAERVLVRLDEQFIFIFKTATVAMFSAFFLSAITSYFIYNIFVSLFTFYMYILCVQFNFAMVIKINVPNWLIHCRGVKMTTIRISDIKLCIRMKTSHQQQRTHKIKSKYVRRKKWEKHALPAENEKKNSFTDVIHTAHVARCSFTRTSKPFENSQTKSHTSNCISWIVENFTDFHSKHHS